MTRDAPAIQPYMPDGRPAPHVLTADEAAEFLRLDGGNPAETLRYYRETAGLRAVQLGRRVRFRLTDLLRFLDDQQARNPR